MLSGSTMYFSSVLSSLSSLSLIAPVSDFLGASRISKSKCYTLAFLASLHIKG